MFANIFQLAGAILTLYAIISRSSSTIRYETTTILNVTGHRHPKLLSLHIERLYAIYGVIYICTGYLIPTIGFDIGGDMLWEERVFMLLLSVPTLILVAVSLADDRAKKLFEKEPAFDPERDIFGIK